MSRQDRREQLPVVEQHAIRLRYAQMRAAWADKRAKLLREQVEMEMQPNMLEAVMLRRRLSRNEREAASNGRA